MWGVGLRFAGQAIARIAGRRISQGGRRADYSRSGARDFRYQSRPERAGGPVEIPGRPVLPAERGADQGPVAARAAAGHTPAGRSFPHREIQ